MGDANNSNQINTLEKTLAKLLGVIQDVQDVLVEKCEEIEAINGPTGSINFLQEQIDGITDILGATGPTGCSVVCAVEPDVPFHERTFDMTDMPVHVSHTVDNECFKIWGILPLELGPSGPTGPVALGSGEEVALDLTDVALNFSLDDVDQDCSSGVCTIFRGNSSANEAGVIFFRTSPKYLVVHNPSSVPIMINNGDAYCSFVACGKLQPAVL